jgi:transcriptional regulator of acetoin/glycerol metabolism
MGNESKDGPTFRSRQEQELGSLARSLHRQAVGAKALLLVADALGLSPAELLAQSARQFRAALQRISVGKLSEVVKAVSLETQRSGATRAGHLSLDAVARFVLDRAEPGSKIDLIERAVVSSAMSACAGNQSAAARLLGIERKALGRRLAKAGARRARKRLRRG